MDRVVVVFLVAVIAGLGEVQASNGDPVYCPFGWTRYGAYCYQANRIDAIFDIAKETCESVEGGTLTIINSEGEQKFHNNLLSILESSSVWLGLTDADEEGVFKWVDGTLVDNDGFTNWADKEPSTTRGSRLTNCGVMKGTEAATPEQVGQWRDEICRRKHPFICRKPISKCPEGWDEVENSCMKVMTDLENFEAAQQGCANYNAKLASIHSPGEQSYITQKANNAGSRLWIGVSDTTGDRSFGNIDGTPLDYNDWFLNQPDESPAPSCVYVFTGEDWGLSGTWNDGSCDGLYGYICRKPTAPCPDGWTARDRFCYLADTEQKSYEKANAKCAELGVGATLTSIASEDEQRLHTTMVTEAGVKLWIGLDDREEEEKFQWLDGTMFSYENWSSTKVTGNPAEDCVAIEITEPGKWTPMICDEKNIGTMCKMPMLDLRGDGSGIPDEKPFVDETEEDIHVPVPLNQFGSYCPTGSTRYGAFCYKTSKIQLSFATATKFCQAQGFTLTSIHSQGEQNFHEFLIREYQKDFWIGLNDKDKEGTFVYTNGDAMDFENWAPDEPDHLDTTEHCVLMSTATETFGQWIDVDCEQYAYAICQTPAETCPYGWESNGDSCYLARRDLVTYDEAKQQCQEYGGALTDVKSTEEQLYLTGVVSKNAINMWIGLDDIEVDGTFKFLDGTVINDLSYTNWGTAQPQESDDGEDCVYLRATNQAGEWTDDQCIAHAGFICKRPKGPCPAGFTARDQFCYLVNTQPVSYQEAQTNCNALGASLTVIRNEDEQMFHTDIVKAAGIDLWIGLNDILEEGSMVWIDGTEATYFDWATGEPSDTTAAENCVRLVAEPIDPNDIGKWQDKECDKSVSTGSVCMKPMTGVGVQETESRQALQCKFCNVEVRNGVVTQDQLMGDVDSCFNGDASVASQACAGGVIGQTGDMYRCFKVLFKAEKAEGSAVSGITRGCIAVDSMGMYSTLTSTTNEDDVRALIPTVDELYETITPVFEMCDADNCNTGPSSQGSEMKCYNCRYETINGQPVVGRSDKDACYSGEGLTQLPCSVENGPLKDGFEFKCYTSPYEITNAKEEIVVGIARGCVAVNTERYGDMTTASEPDTLQDIFEFTLEEDETWKGTSTFCEANACNIVDVSVTECDYCTLLNPCPEWATCVNMETDSGWTCSAPVNICPQPIVDELSLRLVDGPTESEGFLQVYKDGLWGQVCFGFGPATAKVVCRQLGFPYFDKLSVDTVTSPAPVYYNAYESTVCMGDELSTRDCPPLEFDVQPSCEDSAAVVKCLPDPSVLSARLVEGGTPNQGRLEVQYNDGEWSTVCDDGFDERDADVACRMLGYTRAESLGGSVDVPAEDSVPILLDDLYCNGDEQTLLACNRNPLGEDNCEHYEDVVLTCQAPDVGDLRLLDGATPHEGRLAIMRGGEFQSVCQDGFRFIEANVVCQQLGYPAAKRIIRDAGFGEGTGNPMRYDCTGEESRLYDCISHNSLCDHGSDVGVECLTELPEMRLVAGPFEGTGRVEMLVNGVWGTFCDDGFSISSANVVCRSLGYPEAVEFQPMAYYGEGTGPILLDDIFCRGPESHIMQCNHLALNESNCIHSEDISVTCRVPEFGDLRQSEIGARLEIFATGEWGTICDDLWDRRDSLVACRQLGYKYVNQSRTVSGEGVYTYPGPILLDDVECEGSEERLVDCTTETVGENNCGHDEDIIVDCFGGPDDVFDVRLVGGSGANEGRVELSIKGEWGTVCDDSFGIEEANVVCKSLGYSGAESAQGSATFGEGQGEIFLDDLECTGSETSLFECFNYGIKRTNCVHAEDAGVVCIAPEEGSLRTSPVDNRLEILHDGVYGTICDDLWDHIDSVVACRQMGLPFVNYTKFGSTNVDKPIWLDNVACEGTETSLVDCPRNEWGDHNCGHSEDIAVSCLEDLGTSIRLVNGDTENEGRVELLYDGKWGTICDDLFDLEAANVICRQLGYSGAERFGNSYGSGLIYLDDLNCEGTESHVLECTHLGLGNNNCDHSEDVFIVCLEETDLNNECFTDTKARDYRGTVAVTNTGKTCQKWTEQFPQEHTRTQENYPGFGLGDYNYCRNPDNEPDGAWCYTTDPDSRWEYCDVGEPRECITSEKEGSLQLGTDNRLEVYHNDQFGTVCNDNFDRNDAIVACNQLGYRFLNKFSTVEIDSDAGSTPIWMDDLLCQGSEERLQECDFRPWGDTNCEHSEDITLQCVGATGSLCDQPLGMEDRRITDAQITASNHYTWINPYGPDSSYSPEWARLNEDWCWATHMEDTNQWIQVKFEEPQYITGVITQGYSDAWVESYKVEFTEDGTVWQYVTDADGAEIVFSANTDTDTPVTNTFTDRILVTSIRLRPQSWNNWIHVRMELLGCMSDGSSIEIRLADGNSPSEGRVELKINGEYGTICDDSFTDNAAMVVCKQLGYSSFISWSSGGAGSGPIYLENVQCTGEEDHILECQHDGIGVTFCQHEEDVKVVCLSNTDTDCSVPLGMEDRRIADSQLTASDYFIWNNPYGEDSIYSPEWARLNEDWCWATHMTDTNQWIQISFDPKETVTGVITQGYADAYVSSYLVEYTEGGVEWQYVLDFDGEPKLFDANSDTNTQVTQMFPTRLSVTAFRLRPQSWDRWIHMRLEVLGCSEDAVNDGDVRLVDGPSANEGLVELYHQGQWSKVCDDSWGFADAHVVCKQLGFLATDSSYGKGASVTGDFVLDDVTCEGIEDRLVDCSSSGFYVHNCEDNEAAGVKCLPNDAPPSVRLVDADGVVGTHEGRVEILYDGEWGTVCDDAWDKQDADVVCRQLGFVGGALTAQGQGVSTFGQGTGPILLDNVECVGDEENLAQCLHQGYNEHNCGHPEDAAVVCRREVAADTIQIELVGGDTPNKGRIEMTTDGFTRGTICATDFDIRDATVVCRMLGYPAAAAVVRQDATVNYGPGGGVVLMGGLECVGTEANIADCVHSGFGNSGCDSTQDVGIECMLDTDVPIPVRVQDGNSPGHGRIELYYQDRWGTMCESRLTANLGKVLCNSMGFNGVIDVLSGSDTFDAAEGTPIYLDNVICTGQESGIEFCQHDGWGNVGCTHTGDAGIVCRPWADGDVRLVGGATPNEGRLDVYVNGDWNIICSEDFDANAATVACRQLGYTGTGHEFFTGEFESNWQMNFFVGTRVCSGTEGSLIDCYPGSGRQSCYVISQAVELRCNEP